jgi:DNA-binding transcriptional MerR regulator
VVAVDSVVRYRVHAGGVRTSEVAAQARVNAQTLRYYERRGLLPGPERSPCGYRAYTPDAVRVVRFVNRAQLARLVDSCDQPRAERECPILNNIETVAAPTTSAAEQ